MAFSELPDRISKDITLDKSSQTALTGHINQTPDFSLLELRVWYGMVPLYELKRLTLKRGNHPHNTFRCFREYHSWYIKPRRTRTYPDGYSMPLILGISSLETLLDGYHRFHYLYVRGEWEAVPALARTKQVESYLTGGVREAHG